MFSKIDLGCSTYVTENMLLKIRKKEKRGRVWPIFKKENMLLVAMSGLELWTSGVEAPIPLDVQKRLTGFFSIWSIL